MRQSLRVSLLGHEIFVFGSIPTMMYWKIRWDNSSELSWDIMWKLPRPVHCNIEDMDEYFEEKLLLLEKLGVKDQGASTGGVL